MGLDDEATPKLVGHGTIPTGVGGDFDFATVIGNLVYLGNDHGSGAALCPTPWRPIRPHPKWPRSIPTTETRSNRSPPASRSSFPKTSISER